MVSVLRLVLAVAALGITRLDPTEPSRFAAATYTALVLYALYAALLHLASLKGVQFPLLLERSWHWIDVGFYVSLIWLSSGTNSIFFVLFFFSILVASFRWGFASGIRVTVVSVVLYVVVGYAARPPSPDFELGRFILRLSALPVLGYMISHWGGHELRLKRRLALLKEISTLSNPRFGVDRTLGANMERLRVFFRAEQCVAVLLDADDGRFLLRRAKAGHSEAAMRAEPVSSDLAKSLLSFGSEEAVFFRLGSSWRRRPRFHSVSLQGRGGVAKDADEDSCRTAAEILDASSFLTVPMRSRNRTTGRLYLTTRKRCFQAGDLDFLSQVVENVMPVLDNIVLVDRMATRAAEDERQRIARDIHDRIVQPYVALQLGIASLRDLLNLPGDEDRVPRLAERTAKLQALAESGINDLRGYVMGLKYGNGSDGGFVEGVRRFAARFSEATGIEVLVNAAEGFQVNERLAAHVFSMLAEALSNVRRHTRALRCSIELRTAGERLIAVVANETGAEGPPPPFEPRSIAERVATLQGTVSVIAPESGNTVVAMEIPL